MGGSVLGTLAACAYFLVFIGGGMALGGRLFPLENKNARLWLGSVAGMVLYQWLPALFSFVFSFNLLSHLLALGVFLLFGGLAFYLLPKSKGEKGSDRYILYPIIPLFVFFAVTLVGHTLPLREGAMYTGQSAYGDMFMHLGFITSITKQAAFPPYYSILPYEPLGYPFLSETVSSSLYLLGAELRLSYMLPMMAAALQCFFGLYFFLRTWLKDKSKTLLAFLLFFLNGGLGFLYFLDGLRQNPENFTRIFTAFYETPTNLFENNVRWVNVICDMMIPQRATLFGWALLFPTLYLLYKAVFQKNRRYFWMAGILAGAMPMVHTHSFLALGLISAGWLVSSHLAPLLAENGKSTKKALWGTLLGGGALFCLFAAISASLFTGKALEDRLMLGALLCGALVFLACLLYALRREIIKNGWKALLGTWGLYLGVVLLLALPQLATWTFSQSSGGNFLRTYFNWDNQNDIYPWYYIKILGVVALFLVPALLGASRENKLTAAPAFLIWFIAELAVFQPNAYDNNKLLYPAYILLAALVASYLVDLYRKLSGLRGRRVLAAGLIFLCTFSAVLTMGRELASSGQYQVLSKEHIAAAQYIEENAPNEALILTDNNHTNSIAALTGRNIYCGSSLYVYFHGLDYRAREAELPALYTRPTKARFAELEIDYVRISNSERSNYPSLNEEFFKANYPLVFSEGDVQLYKVSG